MIGFDLIKTKRHFTEVLAGTFSQREAEQLMRILLEDLFNINRERMLLEPKMRIDELQYHQLEQAVKRLLEGDPVQYVTGVARFDDLVFNVNPSVLIPRPETEELVQKVTAEADKERPLRIWDIGTGSGCIAIAMAKRLPLAEVKAFDIAPEALEIARQNAVMNGVQVDFILDDVLNPQSDAFFEPVDIVVSNPPYILESERASMERNVLEHEPSLALFVPDDDPLLYYRQILKVALPQLAEGGAVWFEINEAMGEAMLELCRQHGLHAKLINDYTGRSRFIQSLF